MICRQCIRRATALTRQPLLTRPISTFPALRSATESAAATPALSTPTTAPGEGADPSSNAPAAEPKSSCPAGTVLTGLNYFAGKQDPVALPDDEYPAWLWRCLEYPKNDTSAADGAADEFSKSKKQRRLVAKRQRLLEAKILASGDVEALAPKVPLQHQSVNLPDGGSGSLPEVLEAAQKREELKKAMRRERKAQIKEANYLKSM
ncbi:related to mitochondrial ribosomal protein L37p [Cephalotrichum gorgonifer]|uniref:Large ribosomal subunit protein mL54 n=1 Tax=Cephalotrichum gorgonifer TaxID=2041049 RepID=A0AAE8STU6_9PEZI|nr:related to mitochondrial ribosomal protein L37p [Cephalotrichum gorgonifer]